MAGFSASGGLCYGLGAMPNLLRSILAHLRLARARNRTPRLAGMALALSLAACGGPPPLDLDDGRLGYRARLARGSGAVAADNLQDVLVSAADEAGKRTCEQAVHQLLNPRPGSAMKPQLVVPCTLQRLPAVVQHGHSATWLVNSDEDFKTQLMFFGLAESGKLAELDSEAPKVAVTDYTRMARESDCKDILSRVRAKHEASEKEAAQNARTWVEGQIKELSNQRTRACEEAKQATERCAGKSSAADACRRDLDSKACRDAALAANLCQIEQERSQRSCTSLGTVLEQVEARTANPAPARPLNAFCMPG
jgi:hypothetical protein